MTSRHPDLFKGGVYLKEGIIGEGSYGVVIAIKDISTGKEVTYIEAIIKFQFALKQYEFHSEEGIPQNTIREISTLKYLGNKHENIIKLIDVFSQRGDDNRLSLCAVYEKCDMDLSNFILKHNLPDCYLRNISKQLYLKILVGTEFLHSRRVIHRDLKPQNILINRDLSVRIADFGLARRWTETVCLTPVTVAMWYRAPELLFKKSYNSGVDIWSIGCLLAELFNKQPLFRAKSEIALMKAIFLKLGQPAPNDLEDLQFEFVGPVEALSLEELFPKVPEGGRNILRSMIEYNPNKRPTCSKALEDDFFHPVIEDHSIPPSNA